MGFTFFALFPSLSALTSGLGLCRAGRGDSLSYLIVGLTH